MWAKVLTGFGYWDIFSWLVFLAVACFFTLWLRNSGRHDYKEGTYQDEIYFSGNDVPEDGADISVPADSAYWGFVKFFSPYYSVMAKFHNGLVQDYVGYFILFIAVLTMLIVFV